MRTVSFKLPPELDDALTDIARKRRSSRSTIVREALRDFAMRKRKSVSAAARDLVGSVEGPGDLLSNPDHMADFGK